MTNYTPQNPPPNLKQNWCSQCRGRLDDVKKAGCRSKHASCRNRCNQEGWGQLHQKPISEAR